MTKYNSKLHGIRTKSINVYFEDIDVILERIQAAKNEILKEQPTAFDITMHGEEDCLEVQYYYCKSEEEINRESEIERYQKECRYATYLTLKKEFEGN